MASKGAISFEYARLMPTVYRLASITHISNENEKINQEIEKMNNKMNNISDSMKNNKLNIPDIFKGKNQFNLKQNWNKNNR